MSRADEWGVCPRCGGGKTAQGIGHRRPGAIRWPWCYDCQEFTRWLSDVPDAETVLFREYIRKKMVEGKDERR